MGLDALDFIEKDPSVDLLTDNTLYTHSDAALLIARKLNFPWSILGKVGLWFPLSMRDSVYNLIGANRYR